MQCNTPVRHEDRTFWIRTSAACIARGHSTKELLSQLKRPTVLIRYMSAPVYVVNTYNNRGHQMIASRSPLNNQTPAIRMFESCRGHHYGETWPEISPILHSPTFNKASWDRYFSAGIRTPAACGQAGTLPKSCLHSLHIWLFWSATVLFFSGLHFSSKYSCQ